MKVRRVAVTVALVATSLLVTAPAAPAATTTVTAAGLTFVPPVVSIAQGDGVVLQNSDPVPHDLTSVEPGLFGTGNVPAETQAPVAGVEALDPGSYDFLCTIHPWMRGVLDVSETGGAPGLPPLPAVPAVGAVPTPTSLALHDGAVFAASYVQGTVYRMEILAGGALGPPAPYAEGFDSPLGIVFAPDGTLFVADSHPSAVPDRSRAGRVQAVPPGGDPELVVDELPNGRHNTNNLAVHGDRLYITNGNSTDDASPDEQPPEVPPFTGSLLSVPLSARGIVLGPPWPVPREMSVDAVGMRNVYDVAFRPGTDEAWMPTNGPDTLDPFGEDTLVKAVVADAPGRRAPGRRGRPQRGPDDFGFPDCVYVEGDGGPTDPVAGDNVNHPGECADRPHTPPEVLLGLHVSADGLAFGPGGDSPWGDDLYIAEFGNFFGDEVVGHRVVRVPVDGNGSVTGPPEDIVFLPTPLDVLFGPPGTGLYVADFAAGQILLLSAPPG